MTCEHLTVVDTSRQPALDIQDARRLTCASCGLVLVNIDGEHNPTLDALARIPADPAIDTCEGCQ